MRILILYDRLYPEFIGGLERRNHGLALALAERGHEVTLAGSGRGPVDLPAGLNVLSLGPMGRYYSSEGKRSTLQSLRFAARLLRIDLRPYDVIETSNIPYVHLFPLALRSRLSGLPLIVTWYEYWGPYWRSYVGPAKAPLYKVIEWMSAQLGTRVNAISRLTAQRVQQARFRHREVAVIAPGIHLDAMNLDAVGAKRIPGRILFAGRLIREKCVDLLIQAMKHIPEEHDASLVIFGDGPERASLERMTVSLGLEDRITFRGHVEEDAEVWSEMRRAWIAVQPSSREGFGLFPLEAMAFGLPVLYCSSTESALPELAREGEEGLCVRPDPRSLADGITSLLRDEPLRARLSTNATARALAFDWRDLTAGFEKFLAGIPGLPQGEPVTSDAAVRRARTS